ncbi:MAG: NUDIX hydrolase [Halospina sp.]
MQWKPNATVAVVVPDGDRFLMVEEHSEGAVVLNQPAGHIEEGESILAAARREALEETGHPVTLTAFLGIYVFRSPHNGLTYHRHAFIGEAGPRETDVLDDGIIAAHWLTPAELEARSDQLRSPLVATCISDYRNGRRFPLDLIRETGLQ